MNKAFFKNLAEKENGKFQFYDENIALLNGVRSPNITYKVTFSYRDNHFKIVNRTGTAYVGTISCELSKTIQPIEFEINSISHIQNLFLRKKSRLKIKTENANLEYFLNENKNYKSLSVIAQQVKFSPTIACELDDSWQIVSKYHLEFDNWTQVIEPIIGLYKNLIDEYEKGLANVSNKTYREMQ